VRTSRPLGDARSITAHDLWNQVAEDMSDKPYKSLGVDLLNQVRRDHEKAVDLFTQVDHRIQSQALQGRDHRREIHNRLRAEAARRALAGQIDALSDAITRNTEAALDVAYGVIDHLADLKARFERSRERIERAAAPTDEQIARRSSGLSPGV
jgi:hypothetical protein